MNSIREYLPWAKKGKLLKNEGQTPRAGACTASALPFELVSRGVDDHAAENEGIDPVRGACEESATTEQASQFRFPPGSSFEVLRTGIHEAGRVLEGTKGP